MQVEEEMESSSAWSVVPRIAGGALAVPVVLGFVALGAVVVVGRSLRDAVGWGAEKPS
ncbi:MAG TPA: hypothetical protein VGR62_12955 [Candidatus Binatia bacterium]|jgi:hypothetical protein|nr:hypothetical protein [Candidatus Binatia bacterium]